MATLVYKTRLEISEVKGNIEQGLAHLINLKNNFTSENESIKETLFNFCYEKQKAAFLDFGRPKDKDERIKLYDKKDKNVLHIRFLETQIKELEDLLSSLRIFPSELHIEHTVITKINRFSSDDYICESTYGTRT